LDHKYELWAVWGSECWKCKRLITVAMDTAGWSFNPFADIGETWNKSIDENTIRALNIFGIKMELRYSKTVENELDVEYLIGICVVN